MSPWTESEADLLQSLLRQSLTDARATRAVLCLCAEWCGVCREFRAAFEAAQASHPEWLFRWIDVEDEAEQLDELDIETFPTLVLGTAARTVFAGPVLPQAGALERHLRLLAG